MKQEFDVRSREMCEISERERGHNCLGELKNELTKVMCWDYQFFLLVRSQFQLSLFHFLLSKIYLFWNNNIILAFVGLGCGYFLVTSSNVVKRIFTVLCFAHFVKCLGRNILWSSFTPIFIWKSRKMFLNRLHCVFFNSPYT